MNGFVNYYSSSVMGEGVVRGLGPVTYGTFSLYSGQIVFLRNSDIARNKQTTPKRRKRKRKKERKKEVRKLTASILVQDESTQELKKNTDFN